MAKPIETRKAHIHACNAESKKKYFLVASVVCACHVCVACRTCNTLGTPDDRDTRLCFSSSPHRRMRGAIITGEKPARNLRLLRDWKRCGADETISGHPAYRAPVAQGRSCRLANRVGRQVGELEKQKNKREVYRGPVAPGESSSCPERRVVESRIPWKKPRSTVVRGRLLGSSVSNLRCVVRVIETRPRPPDKPMPPQS